MNLNRTLKIAGVFLFLSFATPQVHAQLGKITFDLEKDKPEKFKDKKLRSERTGEKKFNLPRRFIQNTTSHYNYFFNASNRINSVIEKTRLATRDNYAELLPYYSYTPSNTKAQSPELDSVIATATAGILLHDLRSDWVDNFYLLLGKAYYLKQDFDSASMTFQFINYNLFPRKKKNSDDQIVVGTTGYNSSEGLSISTREDRNMIDKITSRPPSRNDALIWQIRTLIDMEEYGEAAGLMNTLSNDPYFPERLHAALEDMEGYWFYKQDIFDSAIVHMENALPVALDNADRARREYLLAQLLEITGDQEKASEYYGYAIRHTTDPLMDIYANLNNAKMLKSEDPAEIGYSINRLLKMARKDKYDLYRDIIYFSAAELAMEIPDSSAAVSFYLKSTGYNEENLSYRNRAFLNLAEISYQQQNYRNAYNYYDSLQLPDSTLGDIASIMERKGALLQIVNHINIIEREDSLQALAMLSPAERDAFLKKLSKKMRKERGVNDEDLAGGNSATNFFNSRNQTGDIFSGDEQKGDWYFYNNSIKSKGFNEFKRTWGKRDNVDNWRRISGNDKKSAVSNQMNTPEKRRDALVTGELDPLAPGAVPSDTTETDTKAGAAAFVQADISVSGLAENIPLTPEALQASNSKIAVSLFELGKNYQQLLEDYYAAIATYEESLRRFPDSTYQGEIYSNLFFCYTKTGNIARANFYKDLLLRKYPGGDFADMVINPKKFTPFEKDPVITNKYQDIYNLFIEGNFERALQEKKEADSAYGQNYWSPQLLYIEAVYHIRQRDDSTAMSRLNELITRFPTSPMTEKATTMIEVLGRRDSIENYLANLQVERIPEDSQIVVFDDTYVEKKAQPVTEVSTVVPKAKDKVVPETAVINPDIKLPPPVKRSGFTFDPSAAQNVVMILNKVDPVYAIEAKNAFTRYNRQNNSTLQLQITRDTLDTERHLLIFSSFLSADDAIAYIDRIRRDAKREVSWLPADKYSFLMISDDNLEQIKENKNLKDYIDLLHSRYPEKF